MDHLFNFLYHPAGIIYLIISGIVFIAVLSKNKYLDLYSTLLIVIFSIFFLGFRNVQSGTDTKGYIYTFSTINLYGKPTDWDTLFYFFAYPLSLIGSNQFFILLNVLFQLILIYYISSLLKIKNKSLVLLAYISFFPGFDMLTNGLRQGLSSSFALLIFVLSYIKKKIPKFSILFVVFMHKSTLPFILYFFLEKILHRRINVKFYKISFGGIVSLIIIWNFVNFSSVLSEFFSNLSIPLMDSGFLLGNKLNGYLLNVSNNILQGIYKYYFTFTSIFLLSHFLIYIKKLKNSIKSESLSNLWPLTFFLTGIYALVWISSYSYRFMYIMFLPGLVSSVLSLEFVKNKYYYIIFWSVTLIAGVLTYGSHTFSEFKFVF